MHSNKEKQGLNKYADENNDKKYIPFTFITPFSPS